MAGVICPVLFQICPCTPQTSLWKNLQYLSLVSSCILPYLLHYAIGPYSSSPSCCFLPYRPISHGWQPLLRHVPYSMLPFQLSHVSFRFKWVHSHLFLLFILYYSSYLSILLVARFSCCRLYCFQLSHQLRVPFPYFCIFWLRYNNIHQNTSFNPSVKVWVCLDHIHLDYVWFTLSYHLYYVCVPRSLFWVLHAKSTYTGLRSVIHLLPTSIWKLPGSPYLRYIQLLYTFFYVRCHSPFPSAL